MVETEQLGSGMQRGRLEDRIRILVIDNDADYAAITQDMLVRASFEVRVAITAAAASRLLRREAQDLAIIEHDLPGAISGIRLAGRLQKYQPDLAVVFTSSTHLLVSGIVACFAAGADDYIEKPCHPTEFLARVEAVIRRVRPPNRAGDGGRSELLPAIQGDLHLNRRNGVASYRGEALHLTTTEFVLLRELYDAHGAVLGHTYLNARALGLQDDARSAALRSHMTALRRKLRRAGAHPSVVRSIRGVGYALC